MALIRRLNFTLIPILVSLFLLLAPTDWKLTLQGFTQRFFLFPPGFLQRQISLLRDLRSERDRLEKELLALTLRKMGEENFLTAPDSFSSSLLRAEIVGRDNTLKTFLVIDKGKREGVEENQTALVKEGVVGRVLKAGQFFSLVETFYSPYLKISGVCKRTQERGVVRMKKEGIKEASLIFDYVEPDAQISPGDTILTSGEGGIFPKGLKIGIVKEIKPSRQVFLDILLQPSVPIKKISSLYLLTRKEKKERLDEKREMEKLLRELELKVPEFFKIR
jgi:rod shape-determining protein MreC